MQPSAYLLAPTLLGKRDSWTVIKSNSFHQCSLLCKGNISNWCFAGIEQKCPLCTSVQFFVQNTIVHPNTIPINICYDFYNTLLHYNSLFLIPYQSHRYTACICFTPPPPLKKIYIWAKICGRVRAYAWWRPSFLEGLSSALYTSLAYDSWPKQVGYLSL